MANLNDIPKEQRHKIYKQLLEQVCADYRVNYGLCFALKKLSRTAIVKEVGWRAHFISYYPELYRHRKPQAYWAPITRKGWEKRIGWIVKAIEDTK